ncbi:MAG: hypothetical protein IPP17_22900 [Bacteroidetes bacterium]|nr:hypothetical protein [Bacteroidota bacterium]
MHAHGQQQGQGILSSLARTRGSGAASPTIHVQASVSSALPKSGVLTVRLVRGDIGGKEPEVLATSRTDTAKFLHSIFKELSLQEVAVETFDRLKNKLKVGVFSGRP